MSVTLNQLMDFMVAQGASDLHVAVGRKPVIRKSGHLKDVNAPELTAADTIRLVKEIAPEKNMKELQEHGSTDWGHAFGDQARFRCAAFKQKNQVGLVTVEDPIEYYHQHKKSIITQRELGNDVPTFSEGLRRALRQDPDVILVGEMRDLETIGAAITAAETGHLVFGTLHTTGATRTVDRIIDAFPTNQQEQVRAQLAVSMIACISQAIMPKVGGGLIAAFEIMVSTSAVENLIREAKTYQLNSVIQTGKKEGMVLLDDYLWDLWNAQKITRLEMFRKASNIKEMREKYDAFRRGKGKLWDDALVADEEAKLTGGGAPPAAAAAAAASQRTAK